jgi:hypothetical protein
MYSAQTVHENGLPSRIRKFNSSDQNVQFFTHKYGQVVYFKLAGRLVAKTNQESIYFDPSVFNSESPSFKVVIEVKNPKPLNFEFSFQLTPKEVKTGSNSPPNPEARCYRPHFYL